MDPLLSHILDSAGRAPSAHNTQPWLLRWWREELEIYVSDDRMLPAIDPRGVETVHGIGAMVENILLTLRHLGYKGKYDVAPQFELDRPLVVLRWTATNGPPSDWTLYRMIPIRRTSRLPYRPEAVAQGYLDAMRAVVEPACRLYWLTNPKAIDEVRALVLAATVEQLENSAVADELYRWTRFSPRDPRWYRDGLNTACLSLKTWEAAVARVLLAPPIWPFLVRCRLHRLILADVDQHAPAAPALGLLTVKGNSLSERIEAGRCLQRSWLTAAAHGLVTHPISAAVDVPWSQARVFELFGVGENGFHVNLFRLGRSDPPARSARLPTDEILKSYPA